MLSVNGIEFRSSSQFSRRWVFTEIKSLELNPQRLVVTDYENGAHHLPGLRHFRFRLEKSIPPTVAAMLAHCADKPVINTIPDELGDSYFTIPVRHGTRFGGTTGILRFRQGGIDYVTRTAGGARSWRWADIQTLANPDRYHLRVGGYLETFDFELEQPLPVDVFDRLWDKVYARNLNISAGRKGGEDAAR
jgi:hypothetical protein